MDIVAAILQGLDGRQALVLAAFAGAIFGAGLGIGAALWRRPRDFRPLELPKD